LHAIILYKTTTGDEVKPTTSYSTASLHKPAAVADLATESGYLCIAYEN
jgi:hypothetical protein